jgi:hypothetical protein
MYVKRFKSARPAARAVHLAEGRGSASPLSRSCPAGGKTDKQLQMALRRRFGGNHHPTAGTRRQGRRLRHTRDPKTRGRRHRPSFNAHRSAQAPSPTSLTVRFRTLGSRIRTLHCVEDRAVLESRAIATRLLSILPRTVGSGSIVACAVLRDMDNRAFDLRDG